MPTLFFEASDGESPGALPDSADLVYLLSFGHAVRYGSQHPLSLLVRRLKAAPERIDLTPLLTFADRQVEEPSDARELERVWQDAAPLAEACRRFVEGLDSGDEALRQLLTDFPSLRDKVALLGDLARAAAARSARVRLTFEL